MPSAHSLSTLQILISKNQIGMEKIPALKFEVGIVSFKPIFFGFCFRLKIDFNFQNVSCAPNFLSSQASATMDQVIYSAPWRPGMKSSLEPVALFQKDWNISPCQIGTPVYSAALLLMYSSVFKCFQLAY
jgi:hypothetical protein